MVSNLVFEINFEAVFNCAKNLMQNVQNYKQSAWALGHAIFTLDDIIMNEARLKMTAFTEFHLQKLLLV